MKTRIASSCVNSSRALLDTLPSLSPPSRFQDNVLMAVVEKDVLLEHILLEQWEE